MSMYMLRPRLSLYPKMGRASLYPEIRAMVMQWKCCPPLGWEDLGKYSTADRAEQRYFDAM